MGSDEDINNNSEECGPAARGCGLHIIAAPKGLSVDKHMDYTHQHEGSNVVTRISRADVDLE